MGALHNIPMPINKRFVRSYEVVAFTRGETCRLRAEDEQEWQPGRKAERQHQGQDRIGDDLAKLRAAVICRTV